MLRCNICGGRLIDTGTNIECEQCNYSISYDELEACEDDCDEYDYDEEDCDLDEEE